MISIKGLTKSFAGDVMALSGVDLEIRRGEFVFITGSSDDVDSFDDRTNLC